jgi:hypothetical protein
MVAVRVPARIKDMMKVWERGGDFPKSFRISTYFSSSSSQDGFAGGWA